MKIKIRHKILITICSLVLLSLVGQVVFNLFFSKSFFMGQQKNIITEAYDEIAEDYSSDLTAVNEIGERLQDTYGIKTMISDDGKIVYSSGYSVWTPMPNHTAPNAPNFPNDKPFQNMDFSTEPEVTLLEAPMPAMQGEGEQLRLGGKFEYEGREVLVLLTLKVESIENSVSVFTEANIYISLTVLIVGILIAALVSKNITEPITEIEAVSQKIATLDFSYVADESSSTVEIASLAASVNQMSRQLDESMTELSLANEALKKDIDYRKQIEMMRREFIAGVSHEMKTPLALLQIYSENLKNNVDGIDKEYYCDTILEETDKLSTMVSEMLEISSIDSGFIQMNLEPIDLSELCREVARQYKPLLSGFEADITIDDSIKVLGDTKYLERAISNLLNNAMQHTAEGGRIRFSLHRAGNMAEVGVYNQGTPIAEEDMEHLWDAFYRADKSRTDTGKGKKNIGLGLYIVKTVMEKHGGTYHIQNEADGVSAHIALAVIE